MDPWGLAAALSAGAVLLGTGLGGLYWLVSLARRGAEQQIKGLEGQLQAARLALAAEIKASRGRAAGAREDFEAERELRDAAGDPDPTRKHERLQDLLEAAQAPPAAASEPAGEGDPGGNAGA